MYLKLVLFLSTFVAAKAAVLLWSNRKLEISPLTDFSDYTLEELIRHLEYPDVTIYKSNSFVFPELKAFLGEYYTAYNPNGDVSTENATEIFGADDLASIEWPVGVNTLSVLVVPNTRFKREVSSSNFTDLSVPTSKGPVLYIGAQNKKTSIILYSPEPIYLFLRTPTSNSSALELGQATMVTVNTASKEQITKLQVKVKVAEDNNDLVVLQFIFSFKRNYWSLKGVSVSRLSANFSANLTIETPFTVPTRYSYVCGGTTRFSDAANTAVLQIINMQVQIDSKNKAFDAAYDCVNFMTVPIWSGLFVTALLAVGLIIALVAIGEIKTMDKFDTQKTKQLSITVAE